MFNIFGNTKNLDDVNGMLEDTNLVVSNRYTYYIIWLLLVLIILSITIKLVIT